MEQSILNSTKKILNVSPDDPSFDLDITTHINTAFSILNDIGVGPDEGFVILDAEPEWDDFISSTTPLGKVRQSKVKTYIFLRVRLLFDPPESAYLLNAMQEQLKELEWRLSVNRESTDWVDPFPVVLPDEDTFVGTPPVNFDGGGA